MCFILSNRHIIAVVYYDANTMGKNAHAFCMKNKFWSINSLTSGLVILICSQGETISVPPVSVPMITLIRIDQCLGLNRKKIDRKNSLGIW